MLHERVLHQLIHEKLNQLCSIQVLVDNNYQSVYDIKRRRRPLDFDCTWCPPPIGTEDDLQHSCNNPTTELRQ